MSIPQATLCEVMNPEDMNDDLANVSFGSTGGEHRLRNVCR